MNRQQVREKLKGTVNSVITNAVIQRKLSAVTAFEE